MSISVMSDTKEVVSDSKVLDKTIILVQCLCLKLMFGYCIGVLDQENSCSEMKTLWMTRRHL